MDAELFNYRSDQVPDFFIRSATQADDSQLVKLITEIIPSNGMILAFERYPSYLAASQVQYNRPDIKVVVPNDQPEKIVGMMNLGWKYCYVNAEPDLLRYVSDLRLHPLYRGQKVLRLLMDYLYDELPKDTLLHSVVLEDNQVACSILHDSDKGFPYAYHYDDIQTFAISYVAKPENFKQYVFYPLNGELVAQANEFIVKMKEFYNFLPSYNFAELADANNPFWLGLTMQDFYLMYDQKQQLVGLYGLWNQKKFKQTRVAYYSKPLKLVKPFYNLYATLTQSLALPKEEKAFEYLMLHSPLCHPDHHHVFENLIFHAHVQTKKRNKRAFCLTLSKKDPRSDQMKKVKAYVLHAKHAFHSFSANPYLFFDREKISYLEAGRI